MLKQYVSIDDETGYIKYYQIVSDEYIRLTPTIWGVFGLAYACAGLSSQFRLDFKWNSDICSLAYFDATVELLNYVFENENNDENNYRIIINTLRTVFDDWNLSYKPIDQRCPSPLFNSTNNIFFVVRTPEKDIIESEVTYEEVAGVKKIIKTDKKVHIDQEDVYEYYNPRLDKNGFDTNEFMTEEKRYECFMAFLKGLMLGYFTIEKENELKEYNSLTFTFHSVSFACSLNQLLLENGIQTEYDYFENQNKLTIFNTDGFLKDITNFDIGFCNEFEPPILISSSRRGV